MSVKSAKSPKPETIHLSEFLATPNGKKFKKMVENNVSELGDDPSKETAMRYLCAAEALYFIQSFDEHADYTMDIEVDRKILDATAEEVYACYDSWLDSEYCVGIIGSNEDEIVMEKISIFYEWSINQEYGVPWNECTNC